MRSLCQVFPESVERTTAPCEPLAQIVSVAAADDSVTTQTPRRLESTPLSRTAHHVSAANRTAIAKIRNLMEPKSSRPGERFTRPGGCAPAPRTPGVCPLSQLSAPLKFSMGFYFLPGVIEFVDSTVRASGCFGVQSSGGNATRQKLGRASENSSPTSAFPARTGPRNATWHSCSSLVRLCCSCTLLPLVS